MSDRRRGTTRPGVAARESAARIVAGVLGGRSLDTLLQTHLPQVPGTDRPLVRELASGTVRHAIALRADVGRFLQRPLKARDHDVLASLLIGAYQLRHMRVPDFAAMDTAVSVARRTRKPWAPGLVNAVLRRAANHAVTEPVPNAPGWLIERLRAQHPRHWRRYLEISDGRAPLCLRVNRRRTSPQAMQTLLERRGLRCRPGKLTDHALVLDQAVAHGTLPHADCGLTTVQDEGAQLAVPLLASATGPGPQSILDACCAPGGKAGHLLEQWPRAQHTLLDVNAERLAATRERLHHYQGDLCWLQGDAAEPASWWNGKPFDAILVDAPCSGTGSMRRHPDIRLLRRLDDIAPLARLQERILRALWAVLRPGGVLLYVTCSLLQEENEQVVEQFRGCTKSARVLPTVVPGGIARSTGALLPPAADANDGFYFALLQKHT